MINEQFPVIYDELVGIFGYSLSDAGVDGYAFERTIAIKAISILAENHVPILGGDVYLLSKEGLNLTYDNWHIDKNPEESKYSYAIRSAQQSHHYIKNYKEADGAITLYCLILDN